MPAFVLRSFIDILPVLCTSRVGENVRLDRTILGAGRRDVVVAGIQVTAHRPPRSVVDIVLRVFERLHGSDRQRVAR